jgi:ABC-type Na+ efflux pump permease subunit
MEKNKSKIYLAILLIVFLVFAGGLAFYFVKTKQEEKQKVEVTESQPNQAATTPVDEQKLEPKTEESKIEEQKKESKTEETQKAETIENIYTSNFKNTQKFSVQYPEGWQANELEEKSEVAFLPQGAKPSAEYTGDIAVTYKKNGQKLSIERFYDGLNDVNLFEDASGGFEKIKVGDYIVYKFKDVVGYVPATIAVFVLDSAFVEVTDVYNKHQKDGVFDKFVETFEISNER